MARKRKLINLDDRCRLCLSENGSMSNLFVESLKKEIKDLTVSTSVVIEREHNLPKNVCHVCLYKLNMWGEFKEQFVQSNELLLTHLEASEKSDCVALKSKIKNMASFNDTAKDDLQKSVDSSMSVDLDNEMPLENARSMLLEDECSSFNDSVPKIDQNEFMDTSRENGEDSQSSLTEEKRQLLKRGKTTEKRKASTKRWVERKKALIAATGEEASESDSMTSDNAELSPVQKARAKTNAEKEAERKKRVDKALKQLEIDANFGLKLKDDHLDESSQKTPTKVRNSKDEGTLNHSIDPKENYVPRSVRSELEIGEVTYIVTSTLFFAESQNSDASSEPKSSLKSEIQSTDEKDDKNTDIFAAVQLRRVNPKTPLTRGSNSLERCLNIEVEGRELDALEHLQVELAAFVEKEMKRKFNNSTNVRENSSPKSKGSPQQSLEHRLKIIVEKAIRTNYETSQGKGYPRALSVAFVEAAERSAVFQPKVLLDRLSSDEIDKLCTSQHIVGKRVCHQPARYQDYDISALDSDEEEKPRDFKYVTKTGVAKRGRRKYGPAMTSVRIEPKHETHMCGICSRTFDSREDIEQHVKLHKPKSSEVPKDAEKVKRMRCKRCHEIVEARLVKTHVCQNRQSHKCNVCETLFRTEKQLVAHLETHASQFKIEALHEDVEVEKMDTIVISSPEKSEPKQTFTCCFCDKIFTDENVLKDHLQKHCDEISDDDSSKEKFQCAICGDSLETEEALESHVEKHLFDDEDDNPNLISIANEEPQAKQEEVVFKCPECPEVFSSEVLLVMHQPLHEEEAEIAQWVKQGANPVVYGCGLCTSIFDLESELAAHMYEHSKSTHLCLLCERLFDTLEQLQEHVQTH